ncbi:MAG: hypothetical protein U1E29_11510, partial [Coriobacteriia bacterium]|nr:hypothetical protein [Coriobacteriia bacterium]
QRFWTEQELAIQKQLDLLKNASEVDESARAAAEQAYQVAESQRAEYVNLLSEYRELLDESLEQGAKSRGRWSRVALVAGIFVALASVGLAAAFGFGVLAPKSPPTASVATNTASASASIPGLVSRQGDFVWVKRVQTVDCEQYVSKAGLTHLTYVVEDGDGNKLQGIFYEGAWDAGTESMMKSGKVLDLYGRVGEYKGEVSLEASQVQESE